MIDYYLLLRALDDLLISMFLNRNEVRALRLILCCNIIPYFHNIANSKNILSAVKFHD